MILLAGRFATAAFGHGAAGSPTQSDVRLQAFAHRRRPAAFLIVGTKLPYVSPRQTRGMFSGVAPLRLGFCSC